MSVMVSGVGGMGVGVGSAPPRSDSSILSRDPQAHVLSQACSTEKGGGSSYLLSFCAAGREPSLQVWKKGKHVLLEGLRCG